LLNTFSEKEKLSEYVMKINRAFISAVRKGHGKIVSLLLTTFKEEKEQLIRESSDGLYCNKTALHVAAEEGHEEIVKLLLNTFSENEKDKLRKYVMKKDEYDRTALHWAERNKYSEIVKLLKQKNLKI